MEQVPLAHESRLEAGSQEHFWRLVHQAVPQVIGAGPGWQAYV
jgi:hypothetical protein